MIIFIRLVKMTLNQRKTEKLNSTLAPHMKYHTIIKNLRF